MKKKGLIISTAVMVVVLIAALTTGTFAWFSTQASAKIEELNVQTQAAKGLEIGLFTLGNNDTFSSGTATFESAWTGSEPQMGATLSFENEKQYMATSGDGLTMFKLINDKAVDSANKVTEGTTLTEAAANTDYFSAYIAVRNTSDAATIVIKSITVTANGDGNTNKLTGMAASLRIALFAVAGTTVEEQGNVGAPSKFEATNLICVYAPFGNLTYSAGKWTAAEDGNEHAKDSENADNKYITAAGTDYASATKTGKFDKFRILYQTGSNAPGTVTDSDLSILETQTETNGILYMQLVIWFEGEDAQCINQFAGGAANVAIEFGTAD